MLNRGHAIIMAFRPGMVMRVLIFSKSKRFEFTTWISLKIFLKNTGDILWHQSVQYRHQQPLKTTVYQIWGKSVNFFRKSCPPFWIRHLFSGVFKNRLQIRNQRPPKPPYTEFGANLLTFKISYWAIIIVFRPSKG